MALWVLRRTMPEVTRRTDTRDQITVLTEQEIIVTKTHAYWCCLCNLFHLSAMSKTLSLYQVGHKIYRKSDDQINFTETKMNTDFYHFKARRA